MVGEELGNSAGELVEHGQIAVEHLEALSVVGAHRSDCLHVHQFATSKRARRAHDTIIWIAREGAEELHEAYEQSCTSHTC